jgi:hypothetical protein
MIGTTAMAMPPFLLALILPGSGILAHEAEFLRSVGPDQGAIFLQIEGISGWEDGCCMVSDRLACTIALIDENGHIAGEAGTRGAGPCAGPASIDCHDNLVAVADFASPRVQLFSRELTHRGTFQSEGPVIDLRFAPDGTLWLSAHTRRGKELLHYEPGGRLLARVLPATLTGEAFSDVFFCATGRDGTLWLAYCVRNLIEVYDSSGKLWHTLAVKGLPLEPPTRSFRRGPFHPVLHLPDGPLIRSIATDPYGNLLILGGDYGHHPGRDLYVVSPDGSSTSVFTLSMRATRIWANDSGLLFAVDDSKSRIDLYRLHYHAGDP